MSDYLKNQWQLEKQFIRDEFGISIRNCAIAFAALMIIAFVACSVSDRAMQMFVDYLNVFLKAVNVTDSEGNISAIALLINNIRAAFSSVMFGLVPFIFFTAYALGINAMLIGAMAAYYSAQHMSAVAFAAGILPHGILEIPALIIAFSMGIYICGQVTKAIMKKEDAKTIDAVFYPMVRTFLLLVVPLLTVAAFVEAYITPLVIMAVK